jgi:hypothetical protein
MSSAAAFLQGALTGGRETTVSWDIAEDVLAEPVFAMRRQGKEISPSALSGVTRLASGVWVLAPTTTRASLFETSAAQTDLVRLADVSAASVIAEVPMNRRLDELTGISASGSVAATSDYFFEKRVPAGVSWQSTVSGGPAQVTLSDSQYPMDRVLVSSAIHAAQTSYLVTFLVPGSRSAAHSWIGTFYFGGPLVGDATAPHKGFGLFALSVANGLLRLSEWIDGAWSVVNEFRFTAQGDGPNTALAIRIIPHFPRFIEFSAVTSPFEDGLIGTLAASAVLALKGASHDPSGRSVFVHQVTNRGKQAVWGGGDFMPITGQGPVALDMRRDLRCRVQISRLQFPASGTLTDRAFAAPPDVGSARILRLVPMGYDWAPTDGPAVTSVSGTLQNASGSALTPANETYTLGGTTYSVTGWNPPGDGLNKCRAALTFTNSESSGARWHTPAFVAYEVRRNGVIQAHAPGSFTGGKVQSISISGAGYHPERETATVVIEDPSNQLATLRTRGRIGVRISTSFPAAGSVPAGSCVLFEGYSGRITAKLNGKAGREYPSPEWREYTGELMGKWDRLADRFFATRQFFDNDSSSPSGRTGKRGLPWRVTDAIKVILNAEGFSDSQLDIFSDDIRLFPRSDQDAEGVLTVSPGTSIPEFLTRIARDYLNAALVWCPNAGSAGMWRLLRPPIGTEAPLWSFVTTQYQAPGPRKLPHLSASYGTNTTPILDPPGELRTYPIPPEFNVLVCSGGAPPGKTERVARTFTNQKSWNGPTHAASADASSLDYLGRRLEAYYVDVTVADQATLDFLGRRAFNLAGRGEKWSAFLAELVLIDAHAAEPSIYAAGKRRPLRAGDTINVNGERWILHDVVINYRKSFGMTGVYTAQLFRPETIFK